MQKNTAQIRVHKRRPILNRFMYLHLNQPSSEPVYLINDGIKMIAQKVFVNYQKRNYDVSLIL